MANRGIKLKIDLEATSKAASDEKAKFFSKTNSLLSNLALAQQNSPGLLPQSTPSSAFGSRSQLSLGLLSAGPVGSTDSPEVYQRTSIVHPTMGTSPRLPHPANYFATTELQPSEGDNRDVDHNRKHRFVISGQRDGYFFGSPTHPMVDSPNQMTNLEHEKRFPSPQCTSLFDPFFFLPSGEVAYTELCVIGKGSGGSVKKAQHKITGELFAIKEIHCYNVAQLEQTRREIQSLFGASAAGSFRAEHSHTQIYEQPQPPSDQLANEVHLSPTQPSTSASAIFQVIGQSQAFTGVVKEETSRSSYLGIIPNQQQQSQTHHLFTSVLTANTNSLRQVSATTCVDSQSSSNTGHQTGGDISTSSGGTASLVALTSLTAADTLLTASALFRHAYNNAKDTPNSSLGNFTAVGGGHCNTALPPSLAPLGSSADQTSKSETTTAERMLGVGKGSSRRCSLTQPFVLDSIQQPTHSNEESAYTLSCSPSPPPAPEFVSSVENSKQPHLFRNESLSIHHHNQLVDSLSLNVAPMRLLGDSSIFTGRSEDGVPLRRIEQFSPQNGTSREPIVMPNSFVFNTAPSPQQNNNNSTNSNITDNPTALPAEVRGTQDTLRSCGTWSESVMTPTALSKPPLGNHRGSSLQNMLSKPQFARASEIFGDDNSFFTNATSSANRSVFTHPSAKRFSGSALTTNASNSTIGGLSHGLHRTPTHAHEEQLAQDTDLEVRVHHVDPVALEFTRGRSSSQKSTSASESKASNATSPLSKRITSQKKSYEDDDTPNCDEFRSPQPTKQTLRAERDDVEAALAAVSEPSVILNPLFGTSPFIVRSYGVTVHDQSVLVAMELLDGSLDAVRKCTREGNGIPEPILASFAFDILSGLDYLHTDRRIVHRDVKPLNLLYSAATGFIKIADFGICTSVDSGDTSNTSQSFSGKKTDSGQQWSPTNHDHNAFVGTVSYMSPERLLGRPYSTGCDVWSTGITLLELAIGSHPFQHYFLQSKLQRLQSMSGASRALSGDNNPLSCESKNVLRLGPSMQGCGGPSTSLGSSMIGSPPVETCSPPPQPVHLSVEAKFWVLLKHLNTPDPLDVADLIAKGRPAKGRVLTPALSNPLTHSSLPIFASFGPNFNSLVPCSPANLKTLSFGMDSAWGSRPHSRAVSIAGGGIRSGDPSTTHLPSPTTQVAHNCHVLRPNQQENYNMPSPEAPFHTAFAESIGTPAADRSTTGLHGGPMNSQVEDAFEQDNDNVRHPVAITDTATNIKVPLSSHTSLSDGTLLLRGSGKEPEEGVFVPCLQHHSGHDNTSSLLSLPYKRNDTEMMPTLPFSSTDSQNLHNTLHSDQKLSATNSASKQVQQRSSNNTTLYPSLDVTQNEMTHYGAFADTFQQETPSTQFINFTSLCLEKDPNKRLSAAQLLQHPFIALRASHSEVAEFLRSVTHRENLGQSQGGAANLSTFPKYENKLENFVSIATLGSE